MNKEMSGKKLRVCISRKMSNLNFKILKSKCKPEEELFTDSSMRETFFVLANRMRKEEILTDVMIIAGGRSFPSHKFVLAANSDYFRSLFDGPLSIRESSVEMHGISCEVMESLLNYFYSGLINISEDNVCNILEASSFFLLPTLRDRCACFLKERLDIENCLQLLSIAKQFLLIDLKLDSLKFVSAIFSELSHHPDFQYLSADELSDIISLENLDVSCEANVLETVLSWIDFDVESRIQFICTFLKTIHLPFVSDMFLQDLLDTSVIIQRSWEAVEMVKSALSLTKRYWSGDTYTYGIPEFWCKPRKCIQGIPSIIAMGGRNVHLFNSESSQWCEITKCKPRHCACMDVLGSYIYVVGGSLEWRRKACGEKYDIEKNEWSSIANMSTPRSNFGMLSLKGKLHAFGGYDGNLPLRSAEMYDPQVDKWVSISDMNHPRDGASSVCDGENIYVIGGYDGSKYLTSVECYHPETDTWTSDEISPIAMSRQNAMAAFYSSFIFVIGGYYDDVYHSSVEKLNLETNTWSFVSPLPGPRHHAGASAMNGHIFVTGGWSGQMPVASVDIYSIENDCWTSTAALPTPMMIRSVTVNYPRKSMLGIFDLKTVSNTESKNDKVRSSSLLDPDFPSSEIFGSSI